MASRRAAVAAVFPENLNNSLCFCCCINLGEERGGNNIRCFKIQSATESLGKCTYRKPCQLFQKNAVVYSLFLRAAKSSLRFQKLYRSHKTCPGFNKTLFSESNLCSELLFSRIRANNCVHSKCACYFIWTLGHLWHDLLPMAKNLQIKFHLNYPEHSC